MAITNNIVFEKKPLSFGVDVGNEDDRIDCAWFNPIFKNNINRLRATENGNRKLVKLKEIAEVTGGKRLPKETVIQENEASIIPYIRATDVKNLKVNVDSAAKITKETHLKIQDYQLKKNDVVITIVGTIGEVGIVEKEVSVCNFTENIARVRIKDKNIIPQYVLHFLNTEFGHTQTERFSVGSLQYKLSLQSCRELKIPIPLSGSVFDVDKQNKLLNSIYSILNKIGHHKKNSQQLIQEAQTIVTKKIGIPVGREKVRSNMFEVNLINDYSARIDTLFNNPLREKLLSTLSKYPNKKLGELTKPQKEDRITPKDYYRIIELEQIDGYTGRITAPREVADLGSEKVLLKNGSIIISKLQPERSKVAIVNLEFDGCVGSSELVPLVIDSDKVTLEYLWAILRSDYVLKQWEYMLTGSSRMRIGSSEIKNTVIPIPNPKLQKEIVEEINCRLKKSDIETNKATQLSNEARNLLSSLLLENVS